jgi:hypothetical protein
MTEMTGSSPFRPTQIAPVELFVGRKIEIEYIVKRCIGQVAAGKPIQMFVEGERGIGKSSIVNYAIYVAERDYSLHSIYASLSAANDMERFAESVLAATVKSGAFHSARGERIRKWLAKYVKKVDAFGLSIELNEDAVHQSAASLLTVASMQGFLSEAYSLLRDTGVKGIVLALDEINGIAADARFSSFLKGLVETNAISGGNIPILLSLSAVSDRYRDMIKTNPAVERLFDVVHIGPLDDGDVESFFKIAFSTARIDVDPSGLQHLVRCAAGHPWIMHIIGDKAYWLNQQGRIGYLAATQAAEAAALVVGPRMINPDSLKDAMRTPEYRNLLHGISTMGIWEPSFSKQQVIPAITESEPTYNNFLQAMKRIGLIHKGDAAWGEWEFAHPLLRSYAATMSSNK